MHGRTTKMVIFAGSSACIMLGAAIPAVADGQQSMLPLESRLRQQFPNVRNLIPEHYEQLKSSRPDHILLLDVREAGEFAVSHLDRAVRVQPGIRRSKFMQNFAARVKGKTVVVYCSVGYRSSKLADRLRQQLRKAGAKDVYNLSGGIFAWHNTGRPVFQGEATTDRIHPYNRKWSKYLDFNNYAHYGNDKSKWWLWK